MSKINQPVNVVKEFTRSDGQLNQLASAAAVEGTVSSQTVAPAAAVTLNLASNNVHRVTLSAGATTSTPLTLSGTVPQVHSVTLVLVNGSGNAQAFTSSPVAVSTTSVDNNTTVGVTTNALPAALATGSSQVCVLRTYNAGTTWAVVSSVAAASVLL